MVFKLLPVLINNEYVGIIHIDDEGNFSFSTNTDVLDAIGSLVPNLYLIYVYNGVYYAESESECISLVSTGFNINEESDFELLSFNGKIDVLLTKGDVTTESFSNTLQEKFAVNNQMTARAGVPAVVTESCAITNFVRQETDNCWAACVATIVNYKKNRSLTAIGVSLNSGIVGGATAGETRTVLNSYGLTYNLSSSKISWSNVKKCISADYPFIICLSKSNLGHAITGYGYSCAYGDSESAAYDRYVKAWDPNGSKISFGYYSTSITTSGYSWTWFATIYDN